MNPQTVNKSPRVISWSTNQQRVKNNEASPLPPPPLKTHRREDAHAPTDVAILPFSYLAGWRSLKCCGYLYLSHRLNHCWEVTKQRTNQRSLLNQWIISLWINPPYGGWNFLRMCHNFSPRPPWANGPNIASTILHTYHTEGTHVHLSRMSCLSISWVCNSFTLTKKLKGRTLSSKRSSESSRVESE